MDSKAPGERTLLLNSSIQAATDYERDHARLHQHIREHEHQHQHDHQHEHDHQHDHLHQQQEEEPSKQEPEKCSAALVSFFFPPTTKTFVETLLSYSWPKRALRFLPALLITFGLETVNSSVLGSNQNWLQYHW
jgi:hypothetical protein